MKTELLNLKQLIQKGESDVEKLKADGVKVLEEYKVATAPKIDSVHGDLAKINDEIFVLTKSIKKLKKAYKALKKLYKS